MYEAYQIMHVLEYLDSITVGRPQSEISAILKTIEIVKRQYNKEAGN